MTTKKTDRTTTPVEDPAVVAGKEAAEAAAAFNAVGHTVDETSPEFVAANERTTEADDIFADAPVTSAAGALAKLEELRALLSPPEHDPDETSLDARHFKTVVAFLEGRAAAVEPDPVVTLFAEWGTIQDEATAIIDAGPEPTDNETDRLWNAALDRRDVVQDRIMETLATSMRGVAIKIRIATHYILEGGDIHRRHATPSRDIDYEEADPGLGASGLYVVSALRDAERLAGVS